MKILMVCLGNICRSPMAEGILRQRSEEQRLLFDIDSAGTSGLHAGEAPDKRAILCMAHRGIDISNLRSRKFNSTDFEKFDLILVMDQSNYTDVIGLAKNDKDKEKVQLILADFGNKSVPDPWYGEQQGFDEVFELLDKACLHFLTRYKSEK